MPAVVHVLSGPAGSGKTPRLQQLWLERARHDPGSALWIGPTRRAVAEVRAEIIRRAGSLIGMRLAAFPEYLDEIVVHNDPNARILSDVQRRLLCDELLAHLQASGRIPQFDRVLELRGFGDGVLNLLEELRRAGVSSASFAESAEGMGVKGKQYAAVYAAYERELTRRKLLDREGRAWRACELLRQGRCQPYSGVRAIFFDGFTDFTPAQAEVFNWWSNEMDDLWLALPDENSEERAELFARPRQTLRRLGKTGVLIEPTALAAPETRPPAGLVHLERQLFRPLRHVETSADAAGLEVIEAPGFVGEVRLIARRIKALLLDGVPAEQIVVAVRELPEYARILHEEFREYGIPTDIEGSESLTHNSAVALLLRAARLPDDDWPFAGVTALLRHTYFRPSWEEAREEMPLKAEALLRLLGEPRGREAYLRSVDRWAVEPQAGLEDEDAEESRRQRTHELAAECRPFLHRFFRALDSAPGRAAPAEHAAWLRQLSAELGVTAVADAHPRDRTALALLFAELDRWQAGEATRTLDRKTFLRRLKSLAETAGLPRSPRGTGRVRALPAMQARHISADYFFVAGLGERGFPRLTPPPSLLDESERAALTALGLPPNGAADLLPEEMLLFYQVITRARRRLVLSYPAVDERGHALLPGSFLSAVLACFAAGAVPIEHRSMLIEGYDRDVPLSAAEYRVRSAAAARALTLPVRLPGDLGANLTDAVEMYRQRFRVREHNPFDGRFRDPAVIGEVARLFGPERVFSPTTLEDYVACPFKFFLRHALRLEPLEEPREEIEVTRRGQAFHRALARLHRRLQADAVHLPTDEVAGRAREEMALAVQEDMQRAAGPATQELWRLEGERLLRLAGRYGDQWRRFVAHWLEKGIAPRPHYFEIDFGLRAKEGVEAHAPLIIRADGIEVRISGRIDRVDVAELQDGSFGFWIIDYKTGRAAHYTGTDLARFERLQLTLYALAAEEVLLAGRKARPLGLAYWLVGEKGPKVALPIRNDVLWLTETAKWQTVRATLQSWIGELVSRIRNGAFPLQPRSETCTETCAYGQVCRIAQSRGIDKEGRLELPTTNTL